jgi:hypothetical protein
LIFALNAQPRNADAARHGNDALRFRYADLISAHETWGTSIQCQAISDMAFRKTPVLVFAMQHVEQTHAYMGGEILSGL